MRLQIFKHDEVQGVGIFIRVARIAELGFVQFLGHGQRLLHLGSLIPGKVKGRCCLISLIRVFDLIPCAGWIGDDRTPNLRRRIFFNDCFDNFNVKGNVLLSNNVVG